jgi:hypothetical protein
MQTSASKEKACTSRTFRAMLIAVALAGAVEQPFAQPIVPPKQDAPGITRFCGNSSKYTVDWGPGYSAWIIKSCRLAPDGSSILIKMEDSLKPRDGVIVLERVAGDMYRGAFETQTAPGADTKYEGNASLRFRADGRAVGEWEMFGGLFTAGRGPLTIRILD